MSEEVKDREGILIMDSGTNEPPPPGYSTSTEAVKSPAFKRATSGSMTLPMSLFEGESLVNDEKRESAVEVIQRFVARKRKWDAIAKKMGGEKVVDAVKAVAKACRQVSRSEFEEAKAFITTEEVFEATKWLLGSLPKDDGLLSFGRDSRSARAFLSASMIVAHPVQVLKDGEEEGKGGGEEEEKGLLVVASKMVVTAVEGLCRALDPTEGGASSRTEQISAVLFFLFARRFQASTISAWKRVDSERLAASIVNPYSQTFAMMIAAVRMDDKDTEVAAKQQLMKMRAAMAGLLGEDGKTRVGARSEVTS